MRKITGILISASVLSLFAFGTFRSGYAGEELVVAGTGDSEALLRVLAREFEKANTLTTIRVPDSIGTSGGIKAVMDGRCGLGRIARLLNDKEKGYGLNDMTFAYSPVVFAVNPAFVGVDSLTTEQIVSIFSGGAVSWDNVGGVEGKIYVVQREAGDSSRTNLEKNLDGWKDIREPAGEVVYSSPEAIALIKKYKGTIGYCALSMAKAEGLTVIKVDGIYPSAENIRNGSYKLVNPFGLVWKGKLDGLAKAFSDYILSPQGQKIVTENGAVPVN
ncbi:MAG: substrate-binding domain-containing protein [Candidatus Omnitrophota bacterium]